MSKLLKGLTLICLSVFTISVGSADIASKPAVSQFISQMVKKHKFNKDSLTALFTKVSFNQEIIKLMNRPYEAKPWYQYKKLFVTPKRVREGLAFWKKHSEALTRASKTYGVPESIIVALIGIETKYGRYTGEFRVIDSLSTLAFDYPSRGGYFKRELEQYLLMTREDKLDPLTLKGSYAGAMGIPQFMPNSYRHYAVDFSKTGKIDLTHNPVDAIGSVANYLKAHGWTNKARIVLPAEPLNKKKAFKLSKKFSNRPNYTLSKIKEWGLVPSEPLPAKTKATVIKLNEHDAMAYWLGFHNFYVLTRYNRSKLYVMAVYELANSLRLAHAQEVAVR